MTAKEYLNQAYYIDRKITLTLEKAAKLRQSLYGRGVAYDKENITQSPSGDAMAKLIDAIVDYEGQADRMISELIAKRREIEQAIKAIDEPLCREVLERRHLLYQRWNSRTDKDTGEKTIGITEAMGYSERQIMRLYQKGLVLAAKSIK